MLPEPEERAALVTALTELIAEHGHSDFLFGPILTPSPEHFPDPWRPDGDGAAAMLRRLLSWHRLGDVPFSMNEYDAEEAVEVRDERGSVFVRPLHGVAVWFAGREGKSLRFGVAVSLLGTPDALAGVLAHEVAHAWRLVKDEWVSDREHEEQLTDVTTVFLGCGVLTCNNADRIRSSGEVHGHYTTFRTARESYGYLSPHALAWLLAVQLHARGNSKEIDRVEAALERNQRASLREGLDLLAKEGVSLGLPPRESWIPPSPLATLPKLELPPVQPRAPVQAASPPEVIAFRLPGSRFWRAVVWGAFGLVPAIPLAVALKQGPAPVALALIPAGIGYARRFRRCSACDRPVDERAELCGNCNARLVGDIATYRDKHDAEDEWRRRQVDAQSRAALEEHTDLEHEALGSTPEE